MRWGEDLGALSMALLPGVDAPDLSHAWGWMLTRPPRICKRWVARCLRWMPPARSGSNPARRRQREKIIDGAPRSSPHRILGPHRVLSSTESWAPTVSWALIAPLAGGRFWRWLVEVLVQEFFHRTVEVELVLLVA